MNVARTVVEILKREGVEFIVGYPVNPILEAAAEADIRPIIVRQERTGLHMADAFSRLNCGDRIGVFAMQFGPGTENAFGGVAQAYGESVPILVLPGGYPRHLANVTPNFSAHLNFRGITKLCERLPSAALLSETMRRAFSQLRNGRPRPVLIEIPLRRIRRGSARATRLRGRRDDAQRPRSRRRCRDCTRAQRGAATGPLRRSGRPLRARLERVAGVGRATEHPGGHQPTGKKRVPRKPPAVARLRRGAQCRDRCIDSCTTPT